MGYYHDKKFRHQDDSKVLAYEQLVEKLRDVFEEAGFSYGLEMLGLDPYWVISELVQSRNITLIDADEDDEEDGEEWPVVASPLSDRPASQVTASD